MPAISPVLRLRRFLLIFSTVFAVAVALLTLPAATVARVAHGSACHATSTSIDAKSAAHRCSKPARKAKPTTHAKKHRPTHSRRKHKGKHSAGAEETEAEEAEAASCEESEEEGSGEAACETPEGEEQDS